MKIALTYNVKPDLSLSASFPSAPPSLHRRTNNAQHAVMTVPLRDEELYAEWDAPETIDAFQRALADAGHVVMIEADRHAAHNLVDASPDIVFNIAEGLHGVSRESYIPAVCEFLDIPFTGSDALTLALCLEKSRTKEILSHYGVPTAAFHVIGSSSELDTLQIDFTAGRKFVKPVREGSGKGIYNSSIVSNHEELKREVERVLADHGQPAMVEDYLEGREFTVALLGNGASLRVLPIIEMTFEGFPAEAQPIYGYESKWIYDLPDKPIEECYRCPAPLTDSLRDRIETITSEAFRVLNCKDWCRIDVRCDRHDNPHIIELNPLPGMIPDPDAHSSFPMAARAAGLGYRDVILTVLDAAVRRYGIKAENPRNGR